MTDEEIISLFSSRGLWDAAEYWLSLSEKDRRWLVWDLSKK
jgi:hypothetical protein